MQVPSRAVVAAVFGAVPLLLVAGCGGNNTTGARTTIAPIQPSSYVTIEPATTTTTTTVPVEEIIESGVSPTEQTYTVQAGDSISRIASLHDITMDQLVNYNQWADGLNHFLGVGDVVLIPPNSAIPGATEDSTPTAEPGDDGDVASDGDDGDCPTTYVIQSGDTSRIKVAERFGITYQEMDAANTGTPGYANFVVGTPITIPCPS